MMATLTLYVRCVAPFIGATKGKPRLMTQPGFLIFTSPTTLPSFRVSGKPFGMMKDDDDDSCGFYSTGSWSFFYVLEQPLTQPSGSD
jgi:hypothetical protein